MLTPRPETPTQALDLAFRRQKPTRAQLDDFAAARRTLLAQINPAESEEHLKTHLRDFLLHPGVFGPGHYVNVSARRDMVARLGPKEAEPVGLLVEVKKFANSGEMVTPTDLNRKAFHELLLYYLQDREDKSAADLRRLVVTDGYQWFVFDALDFDRLFWRNTGLRSDFRAWAAGKKAGKTTQDFYTDIAQHFLATVDAELRFTYFDLRPAPASEAAALHLHKLFHPAHLLKMPFAQDANTLNRAFYEELLYLIGLEEVKDKGRKLIRRCAEGRRQPGSLLENARAILDSEDLLANFLPTELADHGPTAAEQLDAVALELSLTWVNRLLFLKLLEGQLRRYHAPNGPALTAPYRFLTPALLPDYDTLNQLFFQVLNKPADQRTEPIRTQYAHLPYLNSSLYETSELERRTIRVANLLDHVALPRHPKSALPRPAGPAAPEALAYLLRFLDAYDFASEGAEQVQETNKPLLSAAVLGLIFEKLNGYRDGSFYTPGFITMYMARHTLRRAVLQHFNRRYGFGALSVAALFEHLDKGQRPEYSRHFNQLTVLDPAVGSGHFLVSALNELLAIKAELGLLLDEDGLRLRYRLTVARDELVVRHEDDPDDAFFQYTARLDAATGARTVAPEHTRLQRALFTEKRHLMEHALFGVDLNPNSVRICRLRLWIELLKHAYYRPDTGFQELETLPNLDLNVKTGNSLLSRFALSQDLSDVFRQGRFSLATYRDTVHAYFGTRDRQEKQKLLGFMRQLKDQFTQALHKRDPLREKHRKAQGQRQLLETQGQLLPETAKQQKDRAMDILGLTRRIEKFEAEIQQHEEGALFRDAFEWRFEFPEVLDDNGQFRGFDVVIGNPPYIAQTELAPELKQQLKKGFTTGSGNADLYVYFYELGLNLLNEGGELTFITNNKWMRATYGSGLRKRLIDSDLELIELLDFGDLPVFPEATAYPNILSVRRAPASKEMRVAELTTLGADPVHFPELVETIVSKMSTARLSGEAWSLAASEHQDLLEKLRNSGTPLSVYVDNKFFRGVETGLNQAFVIDVGIRKAIVSKDPKAANAIVPFLVGRDVKRYRKPSSDKYLLYIPWDFDIEAHPSIKEHLLPFKFELEKRPEVQQNRYPWFALRRYVSEWLPEFSKPKIIAACIAQNAPFTFDNEGLFLNNKTTIIPTDDKFLLGVLNSKPTDFYYKSIASTKANGYFEYLPTFLAQLPIPAATPAQQAEIAALVEAVLAAKAAGQPTAALEAAIDARVAACYGLSPAEAAQLGA